MEGQKLPLYKFCSADDALKIIISSKLMFSYVREFNDPYDTYTGNLKFDMSDIGDFVKQDIEYLSNNLGKSFDRLTPNEIENLFQKRVNETRDELVITCFSRSHESPLMWAHYAEKHNGICLEFSLNQGKNISPFKRIKHESINAFEMNYEEPTIPINYLKDKAKAIHLLMSQKSEHWKYENEYRISTLNKKGLYEFEKPFLTGIFFGMRYDEAQIEKIKKITSSLGYSNVKYIKAKQENRKLGFFYV